MEKILTAEEMFNDNPILPEGIARQSCIAFMTTFAKLHVEAALKAASENAETKDVPYTNDVEVDKDSILNSYSLDKIK